VAAAARTKVDSRRLEIKTRRNGHNKVRRRKEEKQEKQKRRMMEMTWVWSKGKTTPKRQDAALQDGARLLGAALRLGKRSADGIVKNGLEALLL
jgi:hypothetical protein